MPTLREQFLRPELDRRQRRFNARMERRLGMIVATAVCRAHVAAHGTETEVFLYHDPNRHERRAMKKVTTVTVTMEELFAE